MLSGEQNGYYKWEPTQSAYIKSAVAPEGMWRVPNVYDLVSQGRVAVLEHAVHHVRGGYGRSCPPPPPGS